MKHLFATLLALCVSLANAWTVDLGLGYSKANLHDNGVWYQNGFPNEKVIRRAGVLIGAQHDLSPTWRVHVDGVWLGRNTVSAAFVPNDANYVPDSPTHCRGECLPLAHLTGAGQVYGLAVTAEAHTLGPLGSLGVELGPFLYRSSWALAVPDLYPARVAQDGTVLEVGPRNPPISLAYNQAQWRIGGVIGVRAQSGHVAVSLRRYMDGGGFPGHPGDPWPPLWQAHTVLMVHYIF